LPCQSHRRHAWSARWRYSEEFEVQAYNRLELARQFGERPVDPTIDPKPAVKKKKPAGKAAAGAGKGAKAADGTVAPKKAPRQAAKKGDAA